MLRRLWARKRILTVVAVSLILVYTIRSQYFSSDPDPEPPPLDVPCGLPSLDPFHPSVLPYFDPVHHIKCNSTSYPLLFDVLIDEDGANDLVLVQDPASLGYNDCCYLSFTRGGADTEQLYEELCVQLDTNKRNRWRIDHDYIAVYCRSKGLGAAVWNAVKRLATGSELTLVDMFGFVRPVRPTQKVQKKPNVLLLGLDSISHMNQLRTMPKSRQYLLELGAIEFQGHNLVEENTFTNIIPILTGYKEKELKSVCWESASVHFDNCPFIWKNYKNAGYLTSYGEDASNYGNFLYNKAGFLNQPTDYYTIPLVNAMEAQGLYHGGDGISGDYVCYGPRLGWNLIFEHVKKVAAAARSVSRPFFQFNWATSLTHSDNNYPAAADDELVDLLEWLNQGGYLEKSVVVILSDHGSREGGLRETAQGAMEARMPFLYFLLPKWFRDKYPAAVSNLNANRVTRTTPFDIHQVLIDLLQLGNIEDDEIRRRGLNTSPPPRGVSLFLKLPNPRSCFSAGISFHSCACAEPEPLPVGELKVIEATAAAMRAINGKLRSYPQCSILGVGRIRTAHSLYNGTQVIRVTFEATPSRAIFEATLQEELSWTLVGGVSRLNLYGDQSHCVHEYGVKNLCYCDSA